MIPYTDLINISVTENGEKMEDISAYGLSFDLSHSRLQASTGTRLFLRRGVCEKLSGVREKLKKRHPSYDLVCVYAFRSMDIQVSSFLKVRKELGLEGRNDPEANEQIHHYIAVPEVSGHPTGGAIDLLIADETGTPLDFGTAIHALVPESRVFHESIGEEAMENRRLLRELMKSERFAPYDGEWWHFSYGDREWAKYYDEPCAIYEQLKAIPAAAE